MSELLDLAERLRAVRDEELIHILRTRSLNTNNIKDFFDLAEHLLQPKNLEAWVHSLSRASLEQLAKGTSSATEPLLSFLHDHQLVKLDGFDQDVRASRTPAPENLEAIAGIHAFEATQMTTEVILELETRMMREMGKSGIGLADVKRLAALTGKDFNYVRAVFDLTRSADLVATREDRWRLTSASNSWLELDQPNRWLALAESWRQLLGEYSIESVVERLSAGDSLEVALRFTFPLEKFTETSRFGKVITFAEILGCSVDGHAPNWVLPLLRGNRKEALALLTAHLPKLTDRIIVQADLSVIAPGPLSTVDERELRLLVETEQTSLASRYRLTPLSVSHGIESGRSADELRQTLTRLSGAALPQPVEYLIADVSKRIGRIRVLEDPRTGGSQILSSEPTLLTELANDSRLKPYALTRLDSQALASRFSAEIIYFGLREVGHLAVRVDSSGSVITPRSTIEFEANALPGQNFAEVISRLRESDERISSSSDDDSVMRQITLAIKTRVKLEVTYLGQDEIERILLLEPIGVANGRLRARDRKADIERTLPIENIKGVRLL